MGNSWTRWGPLFLFFLGFAVFVVAFFLPAAESGKLKGYECAWMIIEPVFEKDIWTASVDEIAHLVFSNMSNGFPQLALLTILLKRPQRWIFIGIAGGAIATLIWRREAGLIGYWMWVVGLWLMTFGYGWLITQANSSNPSKLRQGFYQFLLVGATVSLSWFLFQVVHEMGHVLAGNMTGGLVHRIVLDPFQVSWTEFKKNPHPLPVAWGGPLLGVFIPMAAWLLAQRLWKSAAFLFRFFAGFCAVANGFYLIMDAFIQAGDGRTLIRHGAASWQLILFGIVSIPAGFWCWHGLSGKFGFGPRKEPINEMVVLGVFLSLILLLVLEVFYSMGF